MCLVVIGIVVYTGYIVLENTKKEFDIMNKYCEHRKDGNYTIDNEMHARFACKNHSAYIEYAI